MRISLSMRAVTMPLNSGSGMPGARKVLSMIGIHLSIQAMRNGLRTRAKLVWSGYPRQRGLIMRRKQRYWGRGLLDRPQLSLSVVSSCRKSMRTFKHPLGETYLSVIVLRTMKINSQDALSRLLAKTHLVPSMIKNWKRKTNLIHFKRAADQLYRCKMKKFLTRILGLVNTMFTIKLLNRISPPFKKIQK